MFSCRRPVLIGHGSSDNVAVSGDIGQEGAIMWARVSSYSFDIAEGEESLQQGVRAFEEALPQIRDMGAARGAYLLVDRTTGDALTITLWEDEEALRSSAEAADRVRQQSAGEAIRDVRAYEVVMHQHFE